MNVTKYEELKKKSKNDLALLIMRNGIQEAMCFFDIPEVAKIIEDNQRINRANAILLEQIKVMQNNEKLLAKALDLANERLLMIEIKMAKEGK